MLYGGKSKFMVTCYNGGGSEFVAACSPASPQPARACTHPSQRGMAALVFAVDGAMVARGDLGAELPVEEVPYWQSKIVQARRRSRATGLPLPAWATQQAPPRALASEAGARACGPAPRSICLPPLPAKLCRAAGGGASPS